MCGRRGLLLGAGAVVLIAVVLGVLVLVSRPDTTRTRSSGTRWQNRAGQRVNASDLHDRLADIERSSGQRCFLAGTRVHGARPTVRLLNFGYCGPVFFGGHHEYEVYVVLDAGGLLDRPYQLTARSDLAYIPAARSFAHFRP